MASAAGAFVLWRALSEQFVADIDRLDRERVAFRKAFAEALDFWPP